MLNQKCLCHSSHSLSKLFTDPLHVDVSSKCYAEYNRMHAGICVHIYSVFVYEMARTNSLLIHLPSRASDLSIDKTKPQA